MYAVFEDGSRQYKVSEGQTVRVDFRGGDDGTGLDSGAPVEFARVLLYCNGDDRRVGQPEVAGMRIITEVVDHPSIKVMIQRFRRRKNVRRLRGHRQFYTAVRVKHILLPGQSIPTPAPAATSPAPQATETPATPPATA